MLQTYFGAPHLRERQQLSLLLHFLCRLDFYLAIEHGQTTFLNRLILNKCSTFYDARTCSLAMPCLSIELSVMTHVALMI